MAWEKVAEGIRLTTKMRAAVYRRYGPPEVVSIEQVKKPVPAADEVLIKADTASVSTGDWRVRSLNVPLGFGLIIRMVFGVFRPKRKILGTEVAGTVVEVGKDVLGLSVGDRVFAYTGGRMGCHAEFVAVSPKVPIARVPDGVGLEAAAAMSFGGTTALHFLRSIAKVIEGESVLVIGASGAVGSAAVQIAKHFGATVTGISGTANLELVDSIGADHTIDYTTTDWLKLPDRYDIIFDTVGRVSPSKLRRLLKPGGRALMASASLPAMLGSAIGNIGRRTRVLSGVAPERTEDLEYLAELASSGEFKPLIDSIYPLEKIIEAYRRVETGHKRGSVLVKFADVSD